jgi:hypothetical protein
MKHTLTPLRYLFLTCFFLAFSSHALNSSATEKQANFAIKGLYHRLSSMPNTSMQERIAWISGQFLGIHYVLGSLGEGAQAEYDQFPQYRIDAFDCDTYVNTVLAIALANSLNSFQQCIKSVRYKNGIVSYLQRNHFTGLDWNKNNQQQGILKDITLSIKDRQNHSVAQVANALIDKPSWYAHKAITTIRLEKSDKTTEEKRLAELKIKGAQLKIEPENVPYLPLTALFSKENKPDTYLFDQIPNGAIIEIVRPNWDLHQYIGTALNISHLGFAIRKKDQLYFRQASSEYGKVIDVPLTQYLAKAKNSPTIKGINVQIVFPSKPLSDCKMSVSKQS